MNERSLLYLTAMTLEADLHALTDEIRSTRISTNEKALIYTKRNEVALNVLELRKDSSLPFRVNVSLISDPLIEEIHPYSTTPFLIEIPSKYPGTEPFIMRSDLRSMRKEGVVSDSLEVKKLIEPYSYRIKGAKLLERSVGEIDEIESVRASIPQGTEVDKRKYLRELRDRIIIDRFISALANNAVPLYSNIQINRLGDIVGVSYSRLGKKPKEFIIEAPNANKYDAKRNEKLSIFLAKLGLA